MTFWRTEFEENFEHSQDRRDEKLFFFTFNNSLLHLKILNNHLRSEGIELGKIFFQ